MKDGPEHSAVDMGNDSNYQLLIDYMDDVEIGSQSNTLTASPSGGNQVQHRDDYLSPYTHHLSLHTRCSLP